jgi:hypothetical protein
MISIMNKMKKTHQACLLLALVNSLGALPKALAAPAGTPNPSSTTVPSDIAPPAVPVPSTPALKTQALVQAWAFSDTTQSSTSPNFRIRRAEIKFSGSVVEKTRWFIQIDPAKSLSAGTISTSNDNKILQDIGIGYGLTDSLELIVGQFKSQSASENFDSSSELLLPERSVLNRIFGDRRETGLALIWKNGDFKYAAMISNDTNTNTLDTNSKKALSFRADWDAAPLLKIGAFTDAQDYSWNQRGRYGLNAKLKMEALQLRAEYASASTLVTPGAANIKTTAMNVDAGYSLSDTWQPVARFDRVKPNTESGPTGTAETFGLNYFLKGHSQKIQAAVTVMNNLRGSNGAVSSSTADVIQDRKGTIFTLNFQASI